MSGTGSIAFHAASPDGRDAVVLLLEPGPGGAVRFTEWPAGGFAEPGRTGQCTAAEMDQRVERWRSAGWRFSESPLRIADWLRDIAR